MLDRYEIELQRSGLVLSTNRKYCGHSRSIYFFEFLTEIFLAMDLKLG
jgi:hypothetical protein